MTDQTALWPDVLGRLVRREDLPPDLAAAALGAVLRGEATDAQLAGFAVGLRAKGETPTELAALVRTMLEHSAHVDVDGPLLDTCGTGGDRAGTVNVSTLAALVAAAAGAAVAKHGNRAASSRCGSADVLEALGVAIDLGPKGVERCIADTGIGFCFAPRYHPAMRFAGPVRGQLGVPTTFNILGPLANPAGASRRTVGVADPAMAERVVGRSPSSASSTPSSSTATTGSTSSPRPRPPPCTSGATAPPAATTSPSLDHRDRRRSRTPTTPTVHLSHR